MAHLLQAKHRELLLLLQMLACRGSDEFLALSIEQFGAVSPALLHEAEDILATVPRRRGRPRAVARCRRVRRGWRRPSSTGTGRSRPTSSRTSSCATGAPG